MFDRSECEDRPYECCLVTPFPNKLPFHSKHCGIVWPNICVWFFPLLLLLLHLQLIYSSDLFTLNGLLNHVMVCRSLSKTIIAYCCRRWRRSSFSLSQSKHTNNNRTWSACVCARRRVRLRDHSIAIFSTQHFETTFSVCLRFYSE